MTQETKSSRFAPKFQLGQIVATPGAIAACSPEHLTRCLHRHSQGDWGVLCDEDKADNDQALLEGECVLSAYAIDESQPIKGYGNNCLWIITERDRSVTTFLQPSDYTDRRKDILLQLAENIPAVALTPVAGLSLVPLPSNALERRLLVLLQFLELLTLAFLPRVETLFPQAPGVV